MTQPIPTLPERMDQIEATLVAGLAGEDISEPIFAIVCEMLCEPLSIHADIFEHVAVARGCHAAAQELHRQGKHTIAEGFSAMGQDILAKTIAVIAEFAALDRYISGETIH
ncbi:hypothetical protein [Mesorhizobium sp. YR577]|uniref:hypothetical protein n=1 Tax=Mesorhizobium sp. YR577 TaxID=1884373 RepID=UPI0008E75803|nr:hypothetical protein [Mesorhizobium sp. YR577]SFU21030.1 hypothetical protein SAMN05518861_12541 [Mesorhizobium sp. YR577]